MMIVVGARPNFMKAAPIIAAAQAMNSCQDSERASRSDDPPSNTPKIEVLLVHTGQHYDQALSSAFFADLGLRQPDAYLGVGSGSHAAQTAEVMLRFEPVLLREKPDVLVVVGDVNSTVACALVAAKITYDSMGARPIIAHVEAGLRSFDRTMPEEINRIVTDHISDILFVTEQSGIDHLSSEGVAKERIHLVGNTMIDSLLRCEQQAERSKILDRLGLRNQGSDKPTGNRAAPYAVLTLHRPSNVDEPNAFRNILEGIRELSESWPVVFSVHPRTRKRIEQFALQQFFRLDSGLEAKPEVGPLSGPGIHLVEPLGYLDFLCLTKHAGIVITDSGGIQEETTCLGVPCVTVRENTERPATLISGTNVIAGTNPENIRKAIRLQLEAPNDSQSARRIPEKWDGKAAKRIVDAIVAEFARTLPGSRSASRDVQGNKDTGMEIGTAILSPSHGQVTDSG
jgi:UDP-N-acetylglucosamine 2-epimerase (non-hydrolysing)